MENSTLLPSALNSSDNKPSAWWNILDVEHKRTALWDHMPVIMPQFLQDADKAVFLWAYPIPAVLTVICYQVLVQFCMFNREW